jgi:hypothetical protein
MRDKIQDDRVRVVFCKDCINIHKKKQGTLFCEKWGDYRPEKGYCEEGEYK